MAMTYLPLLGVHEVLGLFSASEEENRLSHILPGLCLRGSLLNESTEGCDTSTRTDHDDGL